MLQESHWYFLFSLQLLYESNIKFLFIFVFINIKFLDFFKISNTATVEKGVNIKAFPITFMLIYFLKLQKETTIKY